MDTKQDKTATIPPVIPKEKKQFLGKLAYECWQSTCRDYPKAGSENFRLWEELQDWEQGGYTTIGIAMYEYFQHTEGAPALEERYQALQKQYEYLRAEFLKEYKESGGKQNPPKK